MEMDRRKTVAEELIGRQLVIVKVTAAAVMMMTVVASY